MAEGNPLSVIVDPIGAGISALGSILSYRTAKKNRQSQEKMNRENIAMQRETNAQQYKMFQEGNDFNRQQALEMFNLENEYNTPEANKQRMLEAGLNPFADSGAVQPMQANTSPASSVSPPNLTAPRGVAPQMDTSFIRDFGNIAAAFHSLATAKKVGVETHQLELTLEPRLKGMYLENDGKEITNKLNKVALDVQQEFAKPKAQAELANILESTQKLVSDILLNDSNISVNDSMKYLQQRQSDLIYSSKLLTDKQKELLEKELNNYDVRFAFESALKKAETYNQSQQGNLAKENAATTREIRPSQIADLKQAIKDKQFGRIATILDKIMAARGIGQNVISGVYNWVRSTAPNGLRKGINNNAVLRNIFGKQNADLSQDEIDQLIDEYLSSDFY